MFTVLTSVVLANNDAAQLDRRLDSIVDASMYPEQLSGSPPRRADDGAVPHPPGRWCSSAASSCRALPPGTETVEVNGVDYRVRTIPVDQQGGVLVSIGIRADSILLSRARIPLYTAVGRGDGVDRRRAGLDAGRARRSGRCAG